MQPKPRNAIIGGINGSVQVSGNAEDKNGTIGLLVERAGVSWGLLLSISQARELGQILLDRSSASPIGAIIAKEGSFDAQT
jgi:hypothetical protein